MRLQNKILKDFTFKSSFSVQQTKRRLSFIDPLRTDIRGRS
jgi:hypothetical protein